jgi:ice-binding like protein
MMTYGFARRVGVTVIATMTFGAATWVVGSSANAANPDAIPMGTAANYAVLGASTVTNTGDSILDGSVGLSPGPSITGFPPGVVTPPATVGPADDAPAQQAHADLVDAYATAVSRPVDTIEPAELGTAPPLPAGVYSANGGAALTLTGSLVLDGNNDSSSVFIFKTDTTITTASDSTVTLINGAQECNVFWQIGTSATLGTGTEFVGNILAKTAITATTDVIVHGRALARDAAVTLDTNRFFAPTCALDAPTTTTVPTTTSVPAVTTTLPATTTTAPITTTVPAVTTTVPAPTTTLPAVTTTVAAPTTTLPAVTTTVPATTTTTTAVPATTTSTATDPTTTTSSSPAPTTTPTTDPTPSTTDPGAASTTTAAATSPGTARGAPTATTAPVVSASAKAAALGLTGSDSRAPLLGAVTIAFGLFLTVVASRRRRDPTELTKR